MATNNSTVLFISYTSEFLPSDAVLIQEDFSNDDLQIVGDLYSTNLPTEKVFIEFMDFLEKEKDGADDSYFDYIPDSVDTLLQIAAKRGSRDFHFYQYLLRVNGILRDLYYMNPLNDSDDAFCWDCLSDPDCYQAYRDITLGFPLPVLA